MSESYQRWFKSATRKILLVLHADKLCKGTLASLVSAAGFAVTDPTVQAAFTGLASAVMMLRDFATDASFRAGVETSDAPLVVGKCPQAPPDAAACEETALAIRAGFTTTANLQVRGCVPPRGFGATIVDVPALCGSPPSRLRVGSRSAERYCDR